MNRLVASALVLSVLAPCAQSASDSVEWCYHLPACDYTTWPKITPYFCAGNRQSPIDIKTSDVTENPDLTAFTFSNFKQSNALKKIENTGRTIKVSLDGALGVSGGGLGHCYDSLQFHLHWGKGVRFPGSEHTLDGKRFPMELHIVNSKSSFKGDTTQAVTDPAGLAALGFFVEAIPGNSKGSPASWKKLTSYLSKIPKRGQSARITHKISLDSLLNGVSIADYFRYNGSLTTPSCNEAVVWTVFKDTIKISADLINLFSRTVRVGDCSSPFMVNVYRGIQPALPVERSPGGGSCPRAAKPACPVRRKN